MKSFGLKVDSSFRPRSQSARSDPATDRCHSAINFELRVWPRHFNLWAQVRSDLAAAVYDAVKASPDMSFPFPQREVRLLRDPQTDSNGEVVKLAAKASAGPGEEDKSA